VKAGQQLKYSFHKNLQSCFSNIINLTGKFVK
jgi:hypothetical protein